MPIANLFTSGGARRCFSPGLLVLLLWVLPGRVLGQGAQPDAGTAAVQPLTSTYAPLTVTAPALPFRQFDRVEITGSSIVRKEQTLSLPVQVHEAGVRPTVRVLLRSAYPLGLFTAERVVELTASRHIHPQPEGSLPLPEPEPAQPGELAGSHAQATRPGREGDDFAGLREWHPGDSLKHVDWRAVARGRPLLVKQWSGGATPALMLDWHRLNLPESQRPGQMARRGDQPDQQGIIGQHRRQPRHRDRNQPIAQIRGHGRRKQQPEIPVHPKTPVHRATLWRERPPVKKSKPDKIRQITTQDCDQKTMTPEHLI